MEERTSERRATADEIASFHPSIESILKHSDRPLIPLLFLLLLLLAPFSS